MELYVVTLVNFLFWIFYFKNKLRTFFNPVTLFISAFLLSLVSVYFADSLGYLRGSILSDSFNVLIAYNLAVLSFLIPYLNFRELDLRGIIYVEVKYFSAITNVLILLLVIFSWLAYILLGGIPIIEMILGRLDISDYNDLIKRLPMGMLSVMLLISTILSLFLSSYIATKKDHNYSVYYIFFILFITFLSTIWQGKRQGILMLVFFSIVRYFQLTNLKNNFSIGLLKKSFYLFILFLFFVLFTKIGKLRTNDYDNNDNGELLAYTMFPVMNFSYTLRNVDALGNAFLPKAVINEILPRRMTDLYSNPNEVFDSFEPTSPSGYLNPWYSDYGFVGIGIGSLLLSFTSRYFYRRRVLSENKMRINMLVLWNCATVGVYNHFVTLNFFILPLFCLYCIGFFEKVTNNK